MLKKIAAALVAASMLTAPVLIASTIAAPAATTQTAKPAKPVIKTVKKHRKHVRHVARHGVKYVKVMRHGKAVYVKAKTRRHHVTQVKTPTKQTIKQGTKVSKPRAA